jgi:hypothetical protein
MRVWRHTAVALSILAVACSSDATGANNEPATLILNGSTKASAVTHWTRTIGALEIGIGFYADGTASFRKCGVLTDITWTRTGPASISVQGVSWSCSSVPGFQGTISSFTQISGSLSDGQFSATVDLNGTPTAQTWVVAAGSP